MELYHLKAVSEVGYDCFDSFVIRAKDEGEARSIANERGGDEVGDKPTVCHAQLGDVPERDGWIYVHTQVGPNHPVKYHFIDPDGHVHDNV